MTVARPSENQLCVHGRCDYCPECQPTNEGYQSCENTDRHLWPQISNPGDPYESIHVTKEGAIGINVQGSVIVKSLREWHRLAGGIPGGALSPGTNRQPTLNEEVYFEKWWMEQSLHSFRKAYGPDEPYRETWGSGFKRKMREAWMARAASETPVPRGVAEFAATVLERFAEMRDAECACEPQKTCKYHQAAEAAEELRSIPVETPAPLYGAKYTSIDTSRPHGYGVFIAFDTFAEAKAAQEVVSRLVTGVAQETPGGPGPMPAQHPAPCWCPYCGEPHSPAVRETRDAQKAEAPLPDCECLVRDKTPSAYHNDKCPRYVEGKL